MLEGILIERLKQAGLEEKEARVYLSLLLLGKGTMMHIARKAGISHSTTFFNLKILVGKGLIVKQLENKQKYYYVSSPNQAFRKFEQHLENEVRQKKIALTEAIDGFTNLYHALTDKPQVKFFQGPEAIKMFGSEMILTKSDQLYEFVNLDQSFEEAPPKKGDHRSKFRREGYKSKTIYLSDNGVILPLKEKGVYSYYLPKGKYDYKGELFILKDKIFFTRKIPNYASIVISDQIFAESMKNLFELALEGVLRYQKKKSKIKKYTKLFSKQKKQQSKTTQPPPIPALV